MTSNGLFPALNQGKKFSKYQGKIVRSLENKIEGFENNDQLASRTNELIAQHTATMSQKETQQSLRQQYESTLQQYTDLLNTVSGTTSSYLSRISPSNPYLNKMVQFSTGELCYVTGQGVAKLIPNKTVQSSIAALVAAKPTQLTIPWLAAYNVPGTQIPTSPPLVSGTNVAMNQSLGNEGSNVFVNDFLPADAKSSYLGCYKHNNTLTFIGDAPPAAAEPVVIENGSFNQPVLGSNTFKYLTSSTDVPGWKFDNAVLMNRSTEWDFPMPYPNGDQCVSLQNSASISQSIKLSMGVAYTLTFWACGRNCCTGDKANPLSVNITTTSNGWVTQGYGCKPTINQWTQFSYTFTVPTSNVFLLQFAGTNGQYNGDQSSAIQNITIASSRTAPPGGTYTYDQCKQAAIEQGYSYFGLQNVNTSKSTGYCAVSNSLPAFQQYGEATVPNQQTVAWSSKTSGQPGNTATLSRTGSLQVVDSTGKAVYSSPSSTKEPSNYLGCYGDQPSRAMSTFVNNGAQQYNLQQCEQAAKQGGYSFFALQNSTSGTNAQCALGNSSTEAMKYGQATNCTQIADGSWSGGGLSNALYTTSNPVSNYTLVISDDRLQVLRGTSPSDNQGLIWEVKLDKGQPNANYVASKGKFGQNWIASGQTLAAGDWIGSPNGYAVLLMQADGNLVAQTFKMAPNCQKMSDGMMGGGMAANAAYSLNKVARPDNIGKVAFIDANAELHAYPDTNQSYTNTYTLKKGVYTPGSDIPGASFADTTVEKCEETCNANTECAGFVTNAAGNYCWPQTKKMFPFGGKGVPNADRNSYIRNRVPTNPPSGVSQNTHNIDTVTYQQYPNGGAIGDNKYGVAKATTAQQQQLDQLQTRLTTLSKQMGSTTKGFRTGTSAAGAQSQQNVDGLNAYLHDLQYTNDNIDMLSSTNELQNIVNDSDIVVLQKNYDYLFWSILAAGTVLVAMNI